MPEPALRRCCRSCQPATRRRCRYVSAFYYAMPCLISASCFQLQLSRLSRFRQRAITPYSHCFSPDAAIFCFLLYSFRRFLRFRFRLSMTFYANSHSRYRMLSFRRQHFHLLSSFHMITVSHRRFHFIYAQLFAFHYISRHARYSFQFSLPIYHFSERDAEFLSSGRLLLYVLLMNTDFGLSAARFRRISLYEMSHTVQSPFHLIREHSQSSCFRFTLPTASD